MAFSLLQEHRRSNETNEKIFVEEVQMAVNEEVLEVHFSVLTLMVEKRKADALEVVNFNVIIYYSYVSATQKVC